MNGHNISTNEDLYKYLIHLSHTLDSKGRQDIADEIRFASRFITGSPSEFLHESQVVLKKLLDTSISLLQNEQKEEVKRVIEQIDVSFRQIGGA
jgi:hypothetical protein